MKPSHEWDAGVYHRVSAPQRSWGLRVVERLELRGRERVLDAGCGTGRVTQPLLERVEAAGGGLVAMDRSLDMSRAARTTLPAIVPVVNADLLAMPFTRAFDVVFSNSVIEHVGDEASQRRFAGELARVGRAYWVQTPNRWFPVEQHLLTPLVHWLPKRWQRRIVPRATVWSALVRPTADRRAFYVAHYLDEVRLLSAGDFAALFPDARLIRERVCGWTKSLVAVRP